ncbi:MAG TPA: hypothetical protein VLT36_20355, partial [Candidatus Dormibacteraeota bacterium]|nr:hypothetical protein [Candidatus Dormibacteraeota bacterium]
MSTLTGPTGRADGTNIGARFTEPLGIVADKTGVLYISDQSNCAIRELAPIGTNWVSCTIGGGGLYRCGSADGTGTNAYFTLPEDVAVDAWRTVYVADYANHEIRLGVPVVPPPELNIRLEGNQLLLSWPLYASNFVLEVKQAIVGGNWEATTNAVCSDSVC